MKDQKKLNQILKVFYWQSTSIFLIIIFIAQVSLAEKYNQKLVRMLQDAAFEGKLQDVHHLINQGAKVNAKEEGDMTALMWAALQDHVEVINLLIKYRANLDLQDMHGNTALIIASDMGHTNSVRILLEAGADTNIKTHYNISALDAASNNSHEQIIELLHAYEQITDFLLYKTENTTFCLNGLLSKKIH